MNLRDRLRIIKSARQLRLACPDAPVEKQGLIQKSPAFQDGGLSNWKREDDLLLSREIALLLPEAFCGSLEFLPVLLPDVRAFCAGGGTLKPEVFTFFDLETTGLSGGAGSLAFLAGFGKIVKAAVSGAVTAVTEVTDTKAVSASGAVSVTNILRVTQYLLLDYPGEPLFLQKCRENLNSLVVSYNGKSFDSQIIKNRCLINGILPPVYAHADLVHPARYLWKRVLLSCRQKDIEAHVLGIERGKDAPGSFAPEAWFSFLRTGQNEALLEICAHNLRDIEGLAALTNTFSLISNSPLAEGLRYRADIEHLALRFRGSLAPRGGEPLCNRTIIEENTVRLLEEAARQGSAIAQFLMRRWYEGAMF